jgi:hypothetical protein
MRSLVATFPLFLHHFLQAWSLEIPRSAREHRILTRWATAKVDYSAINEYMAAHYEGWVHRPYFSKDTYDGAIVEEPVYDARSGVFDDSFGVLRPATLPYCGFQLCSRSSNPDGPSLISDWNIMDVIRKQHLPVVRRWIVEAFEPHRILRMIFWNPMRRGADLGQTRPIDGSERTSTATPTASFAKYPHLDVDVHAYSSAIDFVHLIERNAFLDNNGNMFPRRELVRLIERGCRFCIVNAWTNIGTAKILRAPLGLLATRYDGTDIISSREGLNCFPSAPPSFDRSRWYAFSEMVPGETLLFCQYDRDARKPSDLWHCALDTSGWTSDPVADPSGQVRDSFDVRCLVVLDDEVPSRHDRFLPALPTPSSKVRGMPPLLTVQQSADFCSQQERQRRGQDTLRP